MDYLHDYQHYYERGWPSDQRVLSVRYGYSEWHRYDASAGQSSEERRVYHCAAIQAILFLLVGAFWFIPIGLVIGGVICDFLIMGRNEITMKSMMAAYALFSAIFAFSAICPIKLLQSAFVGAMEKNNIAPEYIQGMLNITSVPMLVVIVAAGLVGGLIGGFIGQKALKKHFIKAGLVSVK